MLRVVHMVVGESGLTGSWKARLGRRAASGIALLLAASCGPGASDTDLDGPAIVYVGAVEGTDAEVALARNGWRWAAYMCGGPETLSSMTAWFQGEPGSALRAHVVAVTEDKQFEATFTEEDVAGTVTLAGTPIPFNATRVSPGGAVGVFQDDSNGCRSGLIVPEAGGPQGAYCAEFATEGKPAVRIFEQVTPIEPMRLRDGFLVARPVISTDRVLRMRPLLLPLGPD